MGHLGIVKYLNFVMLRDRSGNTPLHVATTNNHLEVVKYFIEDMKCNPNDQGEMGWAPLHMSLKSKHFGLSMYFITLPHCDVLAKVSNGSSDTNPLRLAVETQNLELITYLCNTHRLDPFLQPDSDKLLEATEDITILRFLENAPDPLNHAAAIGDVETVKHYLTKEMWDPNKLDRNGNSTLHIAAKLGQLNVVKYLTEWKCNPNCIDQLGRTPLHLASANGHLDVVKYLVDTCRCPLSLDKDGLSPLHRAAGNGHLEIIRFFTFFLNPDLLIGDTHSGTPLHYAAFNGHLEVVRFMVGDMRCDPDCKDKYQRTPLYVASESGHLDVVKYLIVSHNCDPLCPDVENKTPFHRAAAEGRLEVIRYIMKILHGHTLVKDNSENTPLHHATFYNHLDVVKFFIENTNYGPNVKGEQGWTPLHLSLAKKHFDIAKCLIDLPHCDVMAKVFDGSSALVFAVETQNLDIVSYLCHTRRLDPYLQPDIEQLLEVTKNTAVLQFFENYVDHLHHAAANGEMERLRHYLEREKWDPKKLDRYENNTLHIAAKNGQLDVVKYLCANVDPACKGQYERTPLHQASENGHLDVVKYLVDTHHCDPLSQDKDKQTPLHRAASKGHIEVIKYFTLMCKPNLFIRDQYNRTPLHYSAFSGHLEVVKFIAGQIKCDPNCKDKCLKTPLHSASANGHLEVVKYLVDTTDCNPSCQDDDGNTPLHRAATEGELDVVRYLTTTPQCNILLKNNDRNTPLHCATANNHLEVVKLLVDVANCDPNVKGKSDMTPLLVSLKKRYRDIAMYLIGLPHLDVLANCNLVTNPLLLAVNAQDFEMVSHLCNKHRLDPYQQPDRERIMRSAEHNPVIMEFLHNYTDPLHCAIEQGDMNAVKLYVEKKKWNPDKLDRNGENALHIAAKQGHLDLVKYLTGLSKDPINEEMEILCDPVLKNRAGLTAQVIASLNGHRHIVSYLLRTATNKPVFKHDVISPPLSIFVVGNSGSGKSTLVKSLSSESNILGRVVKVKGVTPLTAGIIPTTILSQLFGKVNIYDFAGHKEYYASHEMILRQTTQPLVLLTVKISLPAVDIQKQLLYWLTILSNSSSMDALKTTHVLIIGSHADQVKLKEKREISSLVASLARGLSTLKYHSFIQCDCRYSISDNLNRLRQQLNSICKSIRLFLAQGSDNSNRLCAALMYHLERYKPEQATITVSELYKSVRRSILPHSRLAPFVDQTLLLETCKELSSNGHLLLLPHDKNEEESVLILDKHLILSKVHACLQVKEVLNNEIGMLEEEQLKRILSDLLSDTMEPELAIKYLIFTQFCTKITANQLISVPESFTGVTHYFFPNLVNASRPADLVPPEQENSYTHLYTWGLKCTNAREFLTPRFLHTLFVQLIKCERDITDSKFIIWKSGILLAHSNGTRSIIEVTDQTTRLHLAMQCVRESESHMVKQRSKLILLIKSLLDKVCPRVKREEFLLLPENTFPFENSKELPLSDVAKSVLHGYPTVLFDYDKGLTPKHIRITELLNFDPFHSIEERTLQDLFNHSQSTDAVPCFTMRKLKSALKGCDELAKTLEDKVDQGTREMAYSQLYRELIQYSIFTDGNLYALAGVVMPPCEESCDFELPSISNSEPGALYNVNVLLIEVVLYWKEFGRALGLKPITIESIKSRYLYHQHIQRCFTEVLATWLNGRDRPPDSPGPNWKELIAALKSVDMRDYAHQLVQTLENEHLKPSVNIFSSVDTSKLSLDSLGEVAEYVRDLNHKWFHLGLSLGLRYPTLKDIEASPHHHDVGDHMINMLKEWLDGRGVGDPPSWRSLALALDCPLVREGQLARRIQTEHE